MCRRLQQTAGRAVEWQGSKPSCREPEDGQSSWLLQPLHEAAGLGILQSLMQRDAHETQRSRVFSKIALLRPLIYKGFCSTTWVPLIELLDFEHGPRLVDDKWQSTGVDSASPQAAPYCCAGVDAWHYMACFMTHEFRSSRRKQNQKHELALVGSNKILVHRPSNRVTKLYCIIVNTLA